MGVIASLTVIPADRLNKTMTYFKRGARIPSSDKYRFYIDKAWIDFHEAFKELPEPLPFAVMGPDFKKMEQEVELDFIIISPALVKEVNLALKKLSEEKMIAALKKKAIVSRYSKGSYQRYYFGVFKKAYRMAAKESAGIAVLIS